MITILGNSRCDVILSIITILGNGQWSLFEFNPTTVVLQNQERLLTRDGRSTRGRTHVYSYTPATCCTHRIKWTTISIVYSIYCLANCRLILQ